MRFWKIVAAYLTGWAIAQTFYNRVIRHYRESTWEEEKRSIAEQAGHEAAYMIAELFTRGEEFDSPLARLFARTREEEFEPGPTSMFAGAKRGKQPRT